MLRRVRADLFVEEQSYAKSLGDLFTYELTSPDEESLQLGFLFASGATVIAQFRRLVFRRRRLKRKYEAGEMYAEKRSHTRNPVEISNKAAPNHGMQRTQLAHFLSSEFGARR